MSKIEKKYQIFISSTYLDLIEERQAAVEAIVKMGHIPAGMELFKAGKSQWQTITKWIDESDIYVLILGGRYGSMNEAEGKSYTHLEYEYALAQGKPAFALVLEENFLKNKQNANLDINILEKDNKDKYDEFKKMVLSKIVKFVEDIKDIKIELPENVRELEKSCNLEGWSKGNSREDVFIYMEKNIKLQEEVAKLKRKIEILEKKQEKDQFKCGLTYEKLKKILGKEMISIPKQFANGKENIQRSLLDLFFSQNPNLAIGVKNQYGVNEFELFLYKNVASKLISYQLAISKSGPGNSSWHRIDLTEDGKKLYSLIKNEQIN